MTSISVCGDYIMIPLGDTLLLGITGDSRGLAIPKTAGATTSAGRVLFPRSGARNSPSDILAKRILAEKLYDAANLKQFWGFEPISEGQKILFGPIEVLVKKPTCR